jgi:hypothetical protein
MEIVTFPDCPVLSGRRPAHRPPAAEVEHGQIPGYSFSVTQPKIRDSVCI